MLMTAISETVTEIKFNSSKVCLVTTTKIFSLNKPEIKKKKTAKHTNKTISVI